MKRWMIPVPLVVQRQAHGQMVLPGVARPELTKVALVLQHPDHGRGVLGLENRNLNLLLRLWARGKVRADVRIGFCRFGLRVRASVRVKLRVGVGAQVGTGIEEEARRRAATRRRRNFGVV